MVMYRIAHLSDLHYNTENRETVRSLLDAVMLRQPDHVVISGDLTKDGQAVQFRGLRDLLHKHGLSGADRLTVVPGNHDQWGFIYQTFSHAAGVFGGVRHLRTVRASLKRLWSFRRRLLEYRERDYERELAQFREHFHDTMTGSITAAGVCAGFPHAKLLPENVALIALDSNRLLPHVSSLLTVLRRARKVIRTHDLTLLGENISGSGGAVDLTALENLFALPELAGRRKIAVLHHCPYSVNQLMVHMLPGVAREVQLVNHAALTALLNQHYVELVLHGHVHILQHYPLTKSMRAINSGGTVERGFFQLDVTPHDLRVHRVEHGRPVSETCEQPLPLA